MTTTPPILKPGQDDPLGENLRCVLPESWIEVSPNVAKIIPTTPDRVTPLPFSSGEEYLRLLKEAQRESNHSSRVVSLAGSRRDSPRGSPKSPPNSPNPEMCTEEELKGVYINYWTKDGEKGSSNDDWMLGWSSRLDQLPPKDWKFEHPERKSGPGYSMRLARVGKNSLFSREVLYSLLLTNVISAILGVGIGVWLSRKGYVVTRISAD